MPTVKKFEELEIWIEARRLSIEIIKLTNESDLKSDFKLKEQIKSSSGSIMDYIAEGFERNGNMEFRQFLSIAKGSAGETRYQLYRLFDNGYISEAKLNELLKKFENLGGKIHNFIKYLNRGEFKGVKFNNLEP